MADTAPSCPHCGSHLKKWLVPEGSSHFFRWEPSMDNDNWLAFCNCTYDKDTGEWKMMKKPVKYILAAVEDATSEAGG